MEKRLISRVQPFMKLVVLPYGQQAEKEESSVFRRDHQVPNVEISDVLCNGPPVHQLNCIQGAPISLFYIHYCRTNGLSSIVSRWDKWIQDF